MWWQVKISNIIKAQKFMSVFSCLSLQPCFIKNANNCKSYFFNFIVRFLFWVAYFSKTNLRDTGSNRRGLMGCSGKFDWQAEILVPFMKSLGLSQYTDIQMLNLALYSDHFLSRKKHCNADKLSILASGLPWRLKAGTHEGACSWNRLVQ